MWIAGVIYIFLGSLPWWFKRAGMPLPLNVAKNQYVLAICGVFVLIMCIITLVMKMDERVKHILEMLPIFVYALWMLTAIHREMRGYNGKTHTTRTDRYDGQD